MPVDRSKIARLPPAIREELNQRLLSGETGPKILPWLNSLPEAKQVIAEMPTAGGKLVSAFDDKNLSSWRNGNFARWLKHRDRLSEQKEMASYSMKLAKAAGGDMAAGPAALVAAELLELMETLRDLREQAIDPSDPSDPSDQSAQSDRLQSLAKAIDSAAKAIASIRAGDHNAAKLDLDRQRIAQSQETLALEQKKFQRLTCELFVKWFTDQRAVQAMTCATDNTQRIERLGQIMFGEDWKPAAAA